MRGWHGPRLEAKQNAVNCAENYVHIRGLRQLESEGPRVLCDYSRSAGNIPQVSVESEEAVSEGFNPLLCSGLGRLAVQ